ncbi:phage head spike fiber domain-containing protein [Ruegeria atlantica]|uniref:phage head spike fiber domain-containing protein n=1 Tax=Ruegeria atlantica TaxID=81569 RepID=UPI00147F9754|nr:hypothetical protein [Ruegeria atlantica]
MINLGLSITSLATRNGPGGIKNLNPSLWLDPADMRSLFQNWAGTMPILGPGQPVGLMLDKSNDLKPGPDAVTDGGLNDGEAHWNTNGDATISNGQVRIHSPDGSYSNVVQTDILTVGEWYRLEYTVTAYGFGGLSISGVTGNPPLPTTIGRHSVIIQSKVEYLSIKRRSGPTDITIADIAARSIPGYHAAQKFNDDQRPFLARHPMSGIRNLMDNSASFAGWNDSAGSLTATALGLPEIEMVKLAARVGQSGLTFVALPSAVQAKQTVTFSVVASAAEYPILHFIGGDGFAASRAAFEVDLTTGAILSGSAYVESLGSGLFRVSTQLDYNGTGNKNLYLRPREEMGVDVLGDGVKGILLAQAQLEIGSAPTPYQNRINQYDVTESGQRAFWYLSNDQIDDELVVEFPDLGSDVTEFWADENGVTIRGGQLIGAGNRVVPGGASLYAYGAIGRALSGPETEQLRKFLELRAAVRS